MAFRSQVLAAASHPFVFAGCGPHADGSSGCQSRPFYDDGPLACTLSSALSTLPFSLSPVIILGARRQISTYTSQLSAEDGNKDVP